MQVVEEANIYGSYITFSCSDSLQLEYFSGKYFYAKAGWDKRKGWKVNQLTMSNCRSEVPEAVPEAVLEAVPEQDIALPKLKVDDDGLDEDEDVDYRVGLADRNPDDDDEECDFVKEDKDDIVSDVPMKKNQECLSYP